MAVGWLLSARASDAPRIYAANLAGSAAGCLLALGALAGWGGEGAAVFCAWLAALASLASMAARKFTRNAVVSGVVGIAAFAILSLWLLARPTFLTLLHDFARYANRYLWRSVPLWEYCHRQAQGERPPFAAMAPLPSR